MPRRRFRDRLPFTPTHETHFRWRGHAVSRLEGLTDSVFGFAVTLLIVALEVPRTYSGLMDVVRSFPAFVAAFALLMTFWSAHYRYFRRYGLEDFLTRLITMAILVLVLFSVYPLKFLFSLVSTNLFHLAVPNVAQLSGRAEAVSLYTLYSGGFAGVWLLYALLYGHALRKRHALQLNAAEIIQTRSALCECLITVSVCFLSIVLAHGTSSDLLPGFIYFALAPLQMANGFWHRHQVKATLPR